MKPGERYWQAIEPICDDIIVYDGEDVFLSSWSRVRSELALLYAAHFCQSEVCNGGLSQFFSNSTGVLAPEAISGFRAIGLPDLAAVVEQAAAFFEAPYPRNRNTRVKALREANSKMFERLDREFFRLLREENKGWELAADHYALRVAG